jgi:NADH:ubiquinone oxidoreductase subunit 6 (subunit J)
VSDINAAISTVKKQYDLTELQKNIRTFKSEARNFNITLILSYLLFFVTCAVMLFFLLWNIFVNIKSNMGILMGIGVLILLVIIGYITASSELSPVMIKEGADPATVRWVGAGLFVGYSMFFGTIAVIVGTMIINAVKKNK